MSETATVKASARKSRRLLIGVVATIVLIAVAGLFWFFRSPPFTVASRLFVIEPYLQAAGDPDLKHRDVIWASLDGKSPWMLEIQGTPGQWTAISPRKREVRLDGLPTFYIYDGEATQLPTGVAIPYRITCNNAQVFAATINPLPRDGAPYRFAVVGDAAYGSEGAKRVAYALYQSHSDLILVAGDIVYRFGRVLEYLDHFFPVYNRERASSTEGAPLMRSTLMIAAPGNHDICISTPSDTPNLDQFSDALAYFVLWKQPVDGPKLTINGANTSLAQGFPARVNAFLQAAGNSYPGMTNFSFNEGNSHWTILDANPYMDWTNAELRRWLENDLKSADNAQWKFVLFHQPAFNSDAYHGHEERMRLVADIFQRNHVDIVFAGHVHNYQRSLPLKFQVRNQPDGKPMSDAGEVDGSFIFDRKFDGITNKKPDGVLYIITGCGGAHLTGVQRQSHPEEWQPFTKKMISQFSFTQCDVNGTHLSVNQITPSGAILDHFEIEK